MEWTLPLKKPFVELTLGWNRQSAKMDTSSSSTSKHTGEGHFANVTLKTKNLMKHTLCKHGHFYRWSLDGHFAKKEVEPLVFTSAFIFIPPRDYYLLCHGCLFGWRELADSRSFPFRENRIERWVSEILLLGWRAEIYFHTTFRPAMPDFFQV